MWLLKKQFTNGLFNVLLVLSAISFRILDKKRYVGLLCFVGFTCYLFPKFKKPILGCRCCSDKLHVM